MYLTVIYTINLAPAVPVCLHCGENAPDGALFCAKCGFTLPQGDAPPISPLPPSPRGGMASPAPPPPAPPPPPPVMAAGGPSAYAVPPGSIGAMTGPIAAPPSGKYCVRCRTIISRAAVYCPVCQQPQTP